MFQSLWAKIVSFFMSILISLGIVAAPEKPVTPPQEEKTVLSQTISYELNTGSAVYKYAQGACADDKYVYILMNDSSKSETAKSKIYKVDPKAGKLVTSSPEIQVCFGGDMAYNAYTGEIAVANGDPNKTIITIIDAETLEKVREVDIKFNIYGLAFNKENNCYLAANSGGKAITKLSTGFKKLGATIGVNQTDFTWQSIDSFGDYIYLLGSAPNTIRAFDFKGNEFDTYYLDEEFPVAALVNCGGEFYVTYALNKGKCRLCRLTDFSGQKEKSLGQEVFMGFPAKNGYRVVQGGCFSGKYIYQIMRNNNENLAALYVIDPVTKSVIAERENLSTDHCNDLCYNSKTNEIIILNGDPNKNLLTFLDADTLETKKVVDTHDSLFAIEYDASQNCYYAGRSGAKKFIKFSSDFKVLAVYNMSNNGYTQQGMFISGDKLCFIFWNENCIRVYNKNGKFDREYKLPVAFAEPENGFIYNGNVYIVYNKADYTGGLVYKLNNSGF